MITHPPHAAAASAPALTPVQLVIGGILLLLALWLAYRIGKIILRVVAGLLFLGLAAYGIWYLFLR